MEAGEYLKRELTKIACKAYNGEDDLTKLVAEWLTPWGVELCKNNRFPTAAFFKQYEDELIMHNVFQNQQGLQFYNRNVVLVNSSATVEFSMPKQVYYVLLYSGSKVTVKARNCAIVNVCDITGDNKITAEKTESSDIVIR